MGWISKLFGINKECKHLKFDIETRYVTSAMGELRHTAMVCVKCGYVDRDTINIGSGFPNRSKKYDGRQIDSTQRKKS